MQVVVLERVHKFLLDIFNNSRDTLSVIDILERFAITFYPLATFNAQKTRGLE